MKNKKAVLTLSGGMDSTVMLHMAAAQGYGEIHTLSFDYGQRHKKELDYIRFQIEEVQKKYTSKVTNKIIDVRFIRDIAPTSSLTNDQITTPNIKDVAGEAQPLSYVPFRNNMFTSIAFSYAEGLGCDTVFYGTAQADSLAGYWDGSEPWLEAINNLNMLNREHKIKLVTPLIEMSKKDIILKGVELGVDFAHTWTCYAGEDLPDANSVSSSLRLRGFVEAGYKDPLIYKQQDKLEQVYKDNNCKIIVV